MDVQYSFSLRCPNLRGQHSKLCFIITRASACGPAFDYHGGEICSIFTALLWDTFYGVMDIGRFVFSRYLTLPILERVFMFVLLRLSSLNGNAFFLISILSLDAIFYLSEYILVIFIYSFVKFW